MDFKELIDKYRNLSKSDLINIEPRWAVGDKIDQLSDPNLYPLLGDYKTTIVNLNRLVERTDFMDFDITQLFIDEEHSDYRVCTTLSRWEEGNCIDPPIISISKLNAKKVKINDGRHRIKAAYHLNSPSIPIAVHQSLYSEIIKILEIS